MSKSLRQHKRACTGPQVPSLLPRPVYYPPDEPLKIIHADEDLLVLDKPSGLLTVAGNQEAYKDCLEARAVAAYPTARIVHRLDMDTSGLIILALNASAHRHVSKQFEMRQIEKVYRAHVWGHVADDEGVIDLPLRCDWPYRPRQMVDHDLGRSAVTRWAVVDRFADYTEVLLYPETGRSHQLRVHMMELGHVILGDHIYASGETLAARASLCLHAERLKVRHPGGGAWLDFECRPEW